MTGRSVWSRCAAIVGVILMIGSAPLLGQAQAGTIFGTTQDEQGAALPGVTVTIRGGGAPVVVVSDAQGAFRAVGLPPGSYHLSAALEGFATVEYPSVNVAVGRNTTLEVRMQAAVEETITVTAESPLLDSRRITAGAQVSQVELEKIPSARDPWVILQTTPGVLVDRVNVGGNESGQQSTYTGPGDDGTNSTWSIDGVEITDIGAIGSSPSYYDFDAFEEMQVTTGGSDATLRTGGVGLNMVTKRGTNQWRGTARYLYSDDSWQSNLNFDRGELAPGQPAFAQGNRIVEVTDWGGDIGGPIVKDKLWFWASYGENDIRLLTVLDVPDNTLLETTNAKVNWQVTEGNAATFFYSNNEKIKIGRNASPTRPPETTWNQGGYGGGPTVLKVEDTHIFSSAFFLSAMYSETNGSFQLAPQGGFTPTQNKAALDEDFIWRNTFLFYGSKRPQDQAKVDGSYFFGTGNLSHELKFGTSYREGEIRSLSRWPGGGIDLNFYEQYGYAYNIVQLTNDGITNYNVRYTNAYVQDTITTGNLTLNVGARYDKQDGKQLAGVSAANPTFPALIPQRTFGGQDIGFDWTSISPRLGLTYNVGGANRTLLRASYSRFAEQLSGLAASWTYPLYPYTSVYTYYDDRNGDGHSQANEIIPGVLFNSGNYNPANPSQIVISSAVDSNLDPPMTDELLLAFEHAVRPEFVVGVNFTYRLTTDILENERLVFDGDATSPANINSLGRVHRRSDYVQTGTVNVTLPNGQARSIPVYGLRPGVTTRNNNSLGVQSGGFLTNGDREQEYMGVSFTFNKRLSNRWMARGNFTWSDWEWKVPESEREDPNQSFGGGNRDGDAVVTCVGTGSGAKAGVCINSSWSYSLNGLYQIAPDRAWGFNVAAALHGREGYARPYWVRAPQGGISGVYNLMVTDRPDQFRADDIHVVDLRVEKEFTFDRVGLTVGADVFNVFNEGTVLQRELRLGQAQGNFVREVLSPRVFRLGARLSFN